MSALAAYGLPPKLEHSAMAVSHWWPGTRAYHGLIRTRETEQRFFSKTFKNPFKNAKSTLGRGGNQLRGSSRLLEQTEQNRGRRGRFRGRPGPARRPARGPFGGPRPTRGGGGPPPKTLASQGLLRGFVGSTRRRRTTPAGAFPRRALFSQSDLGVCKTGGERVIRTPGSLYGGNEGCNPFCSRLQWLQ